MPWGPYETLIVDEADRVVTITMNRPRRKNAANSVMWEELSDVVRALHSADDVRAVILTGAGGDFCSGADVSGEETRSRHMLHSMRHIGDLCLSLQRLAQPTVAKVRGVAAGAGLNMALACDMVIAAEGARFSEIFARRGLVVDFGGSWLLPRLVGMHRAKELVLLADIIDAAEADRIGLVNRVVPEAELDDTVDAIAARLAAGPPIALAMSKRLLNNSFDVTLEQALDDEGLAQTVTFSTEDVAEAMGAFIDKRDPVFRGR
ncbi:MAG: enoyl-CoA hydratase/isomerase family protein [Ilumatobacteraceae bacterium]|jgi:enoyl-CoA hydratase/carnithine racemase|nr:enoyl-CoA hydratase [Actinomycetota bacterium]MDA2973243.1 enoyl-CoA hydratase [Actinomycetota bacterium]MDA3009482.1 enoyl-CoA hydratase [Actinomycetota bacterium]